MIESILSIVSSVFKFAFGWIANSNAKNKAYQEDIERASETRNEPAKLDKEIEEQLNREDKNANGAL